jgi:hypothetical protein
MAGSNVIESGIAPHSEHHTLAERRAGVVFGEINLLAAVVERLGVLLVADQTGDERDTVAFQESIKAIASQIGLLADFGAELTGGLQHHGVDIAKWLLPPIYPDASEAEVDHA